MVLDPVPARARERRWPVLVAVLVIGAFPFLYAGMMAGDAEIHLSYAEHAAQGHFFEFNLGEKSAGVTSPGYMLLLASLFRVLPASLVPPAVVTLGFLAWYAFVALLYPVARRLTGDHRWALGATLIGGLLPGSAYNSVVGMENGLFGLVVLLCFYLAMRAMDVAPHSDDGWGRRLILGVVLGCGCWLRPEGFIVSVIATAYVAAIERRRTGRWDAAFSRTLPVAVAWCLLAVALLGFHFFETGDLLPASGKARILSGAVTSISLGPIRFAPAFSIRLLAYFPMTMLFVTGNWLVLKRRLRQHDHLTHCALLAVFWVFFVLYSVVFGSAHLGRYVIFVMPCYVLIGVLAAQWLGQRFALPDARLSWRPVRVALAAGAAVLLAVFAVEARQRTMLGGRTEVRRAMEAPRRRAALSDSLARALGIPPGRPVSLLAEEVQIRYWLDDRFVIRSADGRVDATLLGFAHGRAIDYLGYIKARRVDYVVETPDRSAGTAFFSLKTLTRLRLGESIEEDGVRFTLVGADGTPFMFPLTRQSVYRVEFPNGPPRSG